MSGGYEWLGRLAVEDKVIVDGKFGHRSVESVVRITKTMIIVGKNSGTGRRFRRKDGWLVGGDAWNNVYLREPTPEKLKKVSEQEERRGYVSFINGFHFVDLTTDALRRIVEIMQKNKIKEGDE